MNNEFFDNMFHNAPIMAILRGLGVQRTLEVATMAWDIGVTSVEVPIQTSEDLRTLETLAQAAHERGLVAGAGTVLNVIHVLQAKDCGAAFTVSPGTNLEVIQACADAGLAHLPGVATPSDIQMATGQGLQWVKAFPASVLGTSWLKAMGGPFPGIKFVSTGGMDAHNAQEFLDAGARVIAVGSALEDPRQLGLLSGLLRERAEVPGDGLKEAANGK
ncbi:bifunctional 4-hydroxy-2-oxoglutarate aldolase/2-dehydro-3-deoxy-phosphogluconate aldolase [Arthrobacter sp.]|uniref:bifunctional 4-hydroxy-2-oxoglutarate aldolase/2-dehydro-3-deoxy-phosphogluconate aldolase n=1 Tax=Arthrobacter sp. TaxID=1667 RepID=UPI0026DF57F4|nr:bifunctional 4-hydroxy-2-oxoglutarate aldolase/2-dehydro-3-deoxy-phosphogluconate aldolase [Arthrobacter sp.]MDO5754143.1 bifunctional 4-hydroxy-2-oxoglutarate aldolase/2-dehydro-3-deoxy-phosphogluconate aldolase [Arthrobacter sp.]